MHPLRQKNRWVQSVVSPDIRLLLCGKVYRYQIFVDPVAHDGGTAVGGAIRLARALKHGVEI